MKWSTREKIKVDRVAGLWPIRNVVYDALYRECKRRITTGGTGALNKNEGDFDV